MAGRWRFILFPLRWTQWVGPTLLAGAAALLLATLIVTSGIANLSASIPHPEGWARFLHYTFKRSTAHHAAGIATPVDFGTPAQIAKGAAYYGTACAHCHGGPGLGQNPVALSMRPRPQYLFDQVAGFTPPQLFWIVKHGVKYSGMPAYPAQDRDDEIWSIVAFLHAMPSMSTARYRQLAYGDALTTPDSVGVAPLGSTFVRRRYAFAHEDEWPPESSYTHPSIGFDSFSIDGDVVKTCARCHTAAGTGMDGGAIPNIAILKPDYFRTALARYASGARHSGFMQAVATQLDDTQMAQLALYYTAQPQRRSDSVPGTAEAFALGQRIAVVGIPARGIGACAGCHDVTKAAAKAFPAIDGQHRFYLAGRLRQFRSQALPVAGGNPMVAIAHKLADREIDALAAFYAARSPTAASPIATAHAAKPR
jgi:cytochrome c553